MSGVYVLRETARRTWSKTLRRPVPLTFSLVQPLFWMLIFGFLFHRFTLGPAYAGLSYLDFLLPGVAAMTVLFGASQAGIELVRDLQTGFAQRMAGATSHPGWMLGGKMAADVSRLLLQALAVALLGMLLGARLRPSAPGLVVAILALAAFGVAYGCLSCWIALRTRAQESMAVFVHVVNMPLLFTSTALVPTRQMPDWLAGVARWNPLTRVADALREALLFGRVPDAALLLPLIVLAALCFAAARHAMARAAED
ncbi:MAG TPA: ABC transporter permease [Longimicrobium sp.]|jgi:ABC-2 type transport system permease protein|uniref:ABC transporter permease n=1 Tax=Longimicrobium sp. TaxID=2029185 RepID=UPI002ED83BD3